jgi:anti-sigma28 factor (negative regulator of flagellin synthesis)
MKINPASVYNIYKQNQAKGLEINSRVNQEEDGVSAKKVDTLIISPAGARQAKLSKFDLSNEVQRIAREVHEAPDDQRLSELKAAIANNQYRIPTDTLANAILGNLDRKV